MDIARSDSVITANEELRPEQQSMQHSVVESSEEYMQLLAEQVISHAQHSLPHDTQFWANVASSLSSVLGCACIDLVCRHRWRKICSRYRALLEDSQTPWKFKTKMTEASTVGALPPNLSSTQGVKWRKGMSYPDDSSGNILRYETKTKADVVTTDPCTTPWTEDMLFSLIDEMCNYMRDSNSYKTSVVWYNGPLWAQVAACISAVAGGYISMNACRRKWLILSSHYLTLNESPHFSAEFMGMMKEADESGVVPMLTMKKVPKSKRSVGSEDPTSMVHMNSGLMTEDAS